MSTCSRLSEGNLRRLGRFLKGSKKSLDAGECPHQDTPFVEHRSASLSSLLERNDAIPPRMVKLETLEATMASIESSLMKGTHRKKPKDAPQPGKELLKEIEALRSSLLAKDALMLKMRSQILQLCSQCPRALPSECLSESEKDKVRERLAKIQQDMESKRTALKNLRLTLERLDMSDLDARIRQAEIESRLEKEELSILGLQEESLRLELQLQSHGGDREAPPSLFDQIGQGMHTSLLALTVPFNPKDPSFTAGVQGKGTGVVVDWAEEFSGLKKGDRIVEISGRLVLHGDKEEFWVAAALSRSPFRMVVLRAVPHLPSRRPHGREVQSLKEELAVAEERLQVASADNRGLSRLVERLRCEREELRGERTRLLHRVAYLEDQQQQQQQQLQHHHLRHQHLHHQEQQQQQHPLASASDLTVTEVTVFQKGQRTAVIDETYASPDSYSGPRSQDSAYGSIGPPEPRPIATATSASSSRSDLHPGKVAAVARLQPPPPQPPPPPPAPRRSLYGKGSDSAAAARKRSHHLRESARGGSSCSSSRRKSEGVGGASSFIGKLSSFAALRGWHSGAEQQQQQARARDELWY